MQHEAIGLGVAAERQAEKIHDLALVPAEQRCKIGEARHLLPRRAAPHAETLTPCGSGEIAELEAARLGVPGIDHLRPPARFQQSFKGRAHFMRRGVSDHGSLHRTPPSVCAIVAK